MNCWEFMKCGRDQDGSVKCPAYPNFGRSCWAVAGTLCSGKIQGSYATKLEDCRKCAYYNAMLERGIYLAPSQFEASFVSAAHSQKDIDETVRAAAEVFRALGDDCEC